jgi:hypothetical protein
VHLTIALTRTSFVRSLAGMSTNGAVILERLSGEGSAARRELATLAFEQLLALPLGALVARDALHDAILSGLTRDNAQRIADRHVLPALERITQAVRGRPETVRDLISERGERELRAIVQAGGARYGYLRGAIDSDALRQLIQPVVQQLLFQFTSRLPIPGLGGGGAPLGGLGGIVGRIGKQVQRSAGQLADVGKSLFGSAVRDFSETATSDFRRLMRERIESAEGRQIVERMRERFVSHLLAVEADDVLEDARALPREAIAGLVATVLDHQRELPLFRELFARELDAVLAELSERPVGELLGELGVLEATRMQVVEAIDRTLRALFASDPFAAWLGRLLSDAP